MKIPDFIREHLQRELKAIEDGYLGDYASIANVEKRLVIKRAELNETETLLADLIRKRDELKAFLAENQ